MPKRTRKVSIDLRRKEIHFLRTDGRKNVYVLTSKRLARVYKFMFQTKG